MAFITLIENEIVSVDNCMVCNINCAIVIKCTSF